MRTDIIIKKRLLTMLAVLTLLFLLIGVRIGSLTLFEGEKLTARGVKQWTREGVVTPQRGMIQDTKGKVPVIALIGSKIGCFGGMGFVAAATDAIIMSPQGRLGLTGPEVIEQEMGKEEFDASDKSLISRTTGGKHKYIMGDCNELVEDTIAAFRAALCKLCDTPYEQLCRCRRIGSHALVNEQISLVNLAAEQCPSDAKDMWAYYGNSDPELLPELELSAFLDCVSKRNREVE